MPKVLQEMIQDFARPVTRCDWRTCNLEIANRFISICLMQIVQEYKYAMLKDFRDPTNFGHVKRFIEENKDRYVFYRNRFMCFYGSIHGNVTWIDLLDKEFKI